MPRSSFTVELDAANASWLSNDVILLSTKTGELLLLTLVYDGRSVITSTLLYDYAWKVFLVLFCVKKQSLFTCSLTPLSDYNYESLKYVCV